MKLGKTDLHKKMEFLDEEVLSSDCERCSHVLKMNASLFNSLSCLKCITNTRHTLSLIDVKTFTKKVSQTSRFFHDKKRRKFLRWFDKKKLHALFKEVWINKRTPFLEGTYADILQASKQKSCCLKLCRKLKKMSELLYHFSRPKRVDSSGSLKFCRIKKSDFLLQI